MTRERQNDSHFCFSRPRWREVVSIAPQCSVVNTIPSSRSHFCRCAASESSILRNREAGMRDMVRSCIPHFGNPVALRRGLSCRDHCRIASRRRGKSSATCCTALQEPAARRSGRSARCSGRIKPRRNLLRAPVPAFAPRPMKSQASISRLVIRSKPSSTRSCRHAHSEAA
jgi:hypothetical protein